MEQNGYIKLHRAVLHHPVFKDPQAWRLFCFLLLNADPKGVVRVPLLAIADELASGHRERLYPTLYSLVSMGCIEIAARRPSLVVRIPKWRKWQVNVCRGNMPKSDAIGCPQSGDNGCPQSGDNALYAREESLRIIDKKKEDDKKKAAASSSSEEVSFHPPISSDPAPVQPGHSEPCAYRYPESPEEVRAEATRQGVPMTLEQAREFLEHYWSYDWCIKGTRIPPNCWQWKIRKWMTVENRPRPGVSTRPGDNASPGLSAGEGFDQIGF